MWPGAGHDWLVCSGMPAGDSLPSGFFPERVCSFRRFYNLAYFCFMLLMRENAPHCLLSATSLLESVRFGSLFLREASENKKSTSCFFCLLYFVLSVVCFPLVRRTYSYRVRSQMWLGPCVYIRLIFRIRIFPVKNRATISR